MQETLETLKLFERDIMSFLMANETKKMESSLESKIEKLEDK